MSENLKTWPEIIYLQHGCDEPPEYKEVYKDLEEITWCQKNVEEGDIMYIRADVHEQRIAELTSQIAHMQSDCSEAQSAAEAAQSEIARLIRDAEYLSIENGQLKEEIVGLQHALKAARESLEMLKDHHVARESATYAIDLIDALGEK